MVGPPLPGLGPVGNSERLALRIAAQAALTACAVGISFHTDSERWCESRLGVGFAGKVIPS